MTHILLSHLSKENNSPELAAALFAGYAGNTKVMVASRYEATAVFTVTGSTPGKIATLINYFKPVQLGLFEQQ